MSFAEYIAGGMPYATITINILENGFNVRVTNPGKSEDPTAKLYKSLASVIPQINLMAGRAGMRGAEEEIDPYKENDEEREEQYQEKLKKIQDTIGNAFKEEVPVRKPIEEYVFLEISKLVEFITEDLKSRLPK